MWAAAAPLPYYSAYRGSRRKGSTSANASDSKKDGAPSSPVPASHLQSQSQAQAQSQSHPPACAAPGLPHPSSSITDLLEPAVDGPPSPERIRALSKQMKRVSAFDNKHHSHNTSSGSLRSHTSERPSWDHALENISLSRRSSGRSTASSMPSRERPDSVQIFGKAIFGRKGKLKRESSIHSSSGSSLHSADVSLDVPTSGSKEHANRSLFGRRKVVKGEGSVDESAVSSKKLLISGPYNFQHVTHTRRDHLPTLQRASRMELVSEFSTLKTAPPSSNGGHLKGIHADDLHFSDFSSEHVDVAEGPSSHVSAQLEPHTRLILDRPSLLPRHTSPHTGPRRLVKPSRSQENLRVAPPRPPRPARSPLEPLLSQQLVSPPIPPPRLSSRQSIRYEGFDPLATTTLERPQTSGGFRQPGPFGFGGGSPEPPSTSHGFIPRSELEVPSDPPFSHAVTTPDDEAWPLTSPTTATFDAPLPDVPEEEENYTLAPRSRTSMISNNSSLRGSQSVPLLRQMAQAQAQAQGQGQSQPGQRPPSSGSDTLGRFDLFAAQRALRAAALADKGIDSTARDSWEDDIDYCYEHEAEADCHYEWSRPSLDVSRDDEATPVYGDRLETALIPGQDLVDSPSLLTPSRFDVPALSPASQTSVHEAEAITPTAAAMPVTSNFSLPRSDGGLRVQRARTGSHASSFKESHGFNLSPTLLIPSDYRQQMMMAEADMSMYDDSDAIYVGDFRPFDAMNQPTSAADRASTSTTGTDRSSHSSSSGERHASATSASTAFTKFTMSSASAENLSHWSAKGDSDSATPTFDQIDPSSLENLIPRRPDQAEAGVPDVVFDLRPAPPPPPRSRRRANTTSLSTPPPPQGQYAIFPPVYAGNRI